MELALFLTFPHAAEPPDLASLAGLTEALVHTPAATHDPYLDDGAPPPLVLELHFDAIGALEAALRHPAWERRDEIGAQAMLVRRYPVPVPVPLPEARAACTYLVAYEGQAEDANAWLSYYIDHHPGIMARFPGIRAIAIYTRIDWCSPPGWRREDALQRNKVVFDDPAALTAALNSPVRHEMRADFARFPPYRGRTTHFPMHTRGM